MLRFMLYFCAVATLGRSALVIVHPDADGGPSDKEQHISYLHIASVEAPAGRAA